MAVTIFLLNTWMVDLKLSNAPLIQLGYYKLQDWWPEDDQLQHENEMSPNAQHR